MSSCCFDVIGRCVDEQTYLFIMFGNNDDDDDDACVDFVLLGVTVL